MLEKLTDQQLALLPKQVKKWLDIGLSTEPLDYENAKRCVNAAYEISGRQKPQYFFRFQSPMSAAIGAAMLKNPDLLGAQVWAQVWAHMMRTGLGFTIHFPSSVLIHQN